MDALKRFTILKETIVTFSKLILSKTFDMIAYYSMDENLSTKTSFTESFLEKLKSYRWIKLSRKAVTARPVIRLTSQDSRIYMNLLDDYYSYSIIDIHDFLISSE